MDRRELLGVLGATAAGLAAATGGKALGQEARAHAHAHAEGDIHERCAEACLDCEKQCNRGFHHCYTQVQAGKPGHAKAMHLCVDCGEVCSTAAKLVARMSPLMVHTCLACAESCDDCIAECEKLDDPEMKAVVESLKTCAAACREMVQAMGGHEHGRAGAAR
ncbi:four-helix bundle copper-binding protein [Tautonia sociabilis]|uniref:Four-helix bundle copper-binding protein n=1 Tax=Tautonia sociabilis TaxID=2080755 RepID=A0A432MEA6_9BACT|nr:four-helix bundle copper-binding protein [Tautonia sociabilis]RUL83574.1 four-helix bundle copper-binding protein [Tautonia sociabilis]